VLAVCLGACSSPPATPHGFVLIVLDTLRADALSAYGNPRATSPSIDALAEEGVLFEQVISNAPWTLPAMVGLLSGADPSASVYGRGGLRQSLVERFRDAGFATAAFTEGAMVSEHFGIDRGFETFWAEEGTVQLQSDQKRGVEPKGGIDDTFRKASDWLREHGRERPFFLMVHTYEPHVPYEREQFASELDPGALPRGPYRVADVHKVGSGELKIGEKELRYVRALYDGDVASADRHVGMLLDVLEDLDLADRTVVAVTADHGEEIGDRVPTRVGMHGHALDDFLLRVPLVIHDPTRSYPVRRVTAQVRLVDVLPTFLELAGVALDRSVNGRSLLPLMAGDREEGHPAYAVLRRLENGQIVQATIRSEGYKLVAHWEDGPGSDPKLALFDLRDDPHEDVDLAAERPELRDKLFARLEARYAEIERQGPVLLHGWRKMPATLESRLRSLGYLE
jgi:arylsulfatase A-like enzyme